SRYFSNTKPRWPYGVLTPTTRPLVVSNAGTQARRISISGCADSSEGNSATHRAPRRASDRPIVGREHADADVALEPNLLRGDTLDLSGENRRRLEDRFAVAKDALRLLLGGSKAKRFS